MKGRHLDVLLVDLAAATGGTEKRVLQLAAGLAARGQRVGVVCLADSPLHSTLLEKGIHALPLQVRRADPRAVLALRRLVRDSQARVVDAHNVQSQLWAVLATLGSVNGVVTVHSEYRTSEGGGLRGLLYEGVLRVATRAGWTFIAVSDSVAAYLQRVSVPRERVSVVWSAAEEQDHEPQSRSAMRQRLDLADDDFVAISVGRLVPAKDHELLLRAVAGLPSECRLRLLVVGDGPERQRLSDLRARLGLQDRVQLLGHRTDVPLLMSAADLFVLSSSTEGLPYVLLEAAASGTPVVSTDVGSIGQMFTQGTTAVLVRPRTEEALRQSLAWAMEHPADLARHAEAAKGLLAAWGGVQTMVDRTLDVYAVGSGWAA